MKEIKTCFLMKISQVKDTGTLRGKLERAIELSGYRKRKIAILYHETDIELVCYKFYVSEMIDLLSKLNYLIPEGFIEFQEL